jgi:hypothetical protein
MCGPETLIAWTRYLGNQVVNFTEDRPKLLTL